MLPPDVGCFRANALMASNQAVDSSKVTALPGRGRRLQPRPGGPAHSLPPPRPCQTCSPSPEEVSSPAPAALAMGIDTGPSAHGCSQTPALGHRSCSQGSRRGSPGSGPQGICGRRQGLGAIAVARASVILSLQHKEPRSPLATATPEHPIPSVPRNSWTAWLAPQIPAQPQHHPSGTCRTHCISQSQCMTWGHAVLHEAMLHHTGLMRCMELMQYMGLMWCKRPCGGAWA